MLKALLISLSCLSAACFAGAETKTFSYDCEKWAEGRPPKDMFVVDGTISIKARDGNKVIEIEPSPIVDANALLGAAGIGSASIEARVYSTKLGRIYPRFGVGVHGQSGYRLIVFPARKELQITRNDEVLEAVPFEWTSGVWLKLKLSATKAADGKWTITGKAWPASAPEPASPQIQHQDLKYRGQGKCSIWATPYAGTPIDFDDIQIAVES